MAVINVIIVFKFKKNPRKDYELFMKYLVAAKGGINGTHLKDVVVIVVGSVLVVDCDIVCPRLAVACKDVVVIDARQTAPFKLYLAHQTPDQEAVTVLSGFLMGKKNLLQLGGSVVPYVIGKLGERCLDTGFVGNVHGCLLLG